MSWPLKKEIKMDKFSIRTTARKLISEGGDVRGKLATAIVDHSDAQARTLVQQVNVERQYAALAQTNFQIHKAASAVEPFDADELIAEAHSTKKQSFLVKENTQGYFSEIRARIKHVPKVAAATHNAFVNVVKSLNHIKTAALQGDGTAQKQWYALKENVPLRIQEANNKIGSIVKTIETVVSSCPELYRKYAAQFPGISLEGRDAYTARKVAQMSELTVKLGEAHVAKKLLIKLDRQVRS